MTSDSVTRQGCTHTQSWCCWWYQKGAAAASLAPGWTWRHTHMPATWPAMLWNGTSLTSQLCCLCVSLQVKEFAAGTQLDLQRQIKAWEARAVMAEEQLAHLQVRN